MKPIDFRGIVHLDYTLVNHLKAYFQEKETQLSKIILNSIHLLPGESLPILIPYAPSGEVKLAHAVEVFNDQIRRIFASDKLTVKGDDWELASRQINNALWEYAEVLEGSAVELFQQLNLLGYEHWTASLLQAVDGLKDLLYARLEDLDLQIRQLDSILREYRRICDTRESVGLYIRILHYWSCCLDLSLQAYLKKGRKFLLKRYTLFFQRYSNYQKIKNKIETVLKKFKSYPVLQSLDDEIKENFKKIYHLLKLWEFNLQAKAFPEKETVQTLRGAFSIDRVISIFNEYQKALKFELFEKSRKFKSASPELYTDLSGRRILSEIIRCCRAEVHTLGAAISKYREFFLSTHPNPYVRSRWGFAEWIVGPEPGQAKELLNEMYRAEALDRLYEELSIALKKGPAAFDSLHLAKQYNEIQNTLHEMVQPLISKEVMRLKAERLIAQIQQMDELGSFNPQAVDYAGKILSKALRTDWQHHVLFEMASFHQLYEIHQGIVGSIEERGHMNRLNKFKELVIQLHEWLKKRKTQRHLYEIETGIMDIKGYLQDFLACVQRFACEQQLSEIEQKLWVREIRKQLLEYRYLFGKFFSSLHEYGSEGRQLRNHFLFIDQYFESVENKLEERQALWKTVD